MKREDINEDLPKSFKIFLALQEEVKREIASSNTSDSGKKGDQALSTT